MTKFPKREKEKEKETSKKYLTVSTAKCHKKFLKQKTENNA